MARRIINIIATISGFVVAGFPGAIVGYVLGIIVGAIIS
jgi:hypothetical protein